MQTSTLPSNECKSVDGVPPVRELSDLYITCQLFADNKAITLPIRTAHHSFNAHWTWNEWLTIPLRYRDLPLGSQLTFTVWEAYAPRRAVPLGGTTFRVFGKYKYALLD
ncbi:hypothetical protein PhCBS80983_g01626 [Powellomyces hirtus]|uniref:C2 PI3K-type domain-containing protein n=1 Tax=Powellomyces hirtus TaxID=109895 RepID=A0A507EA82_9FUNG|nr:hypothetical protein PhCBS80983_g01626 [Powellomyces hirtus]